jgi:hypothetical protein
MEVASHLVELSTVHPRLLWDDIVAAAVAVLEQNTAPPPFRLELTIEDLPTYDDETLLLTILPDGVSPAHVTRLRRTYETSRLVEMAAIAVAGLAIFHAAHLEIRDIALHGSRADYLVGKGGHLLEVGGRSRRGDFGTAWREKWEHLKEHQGGGFFLCVVEFETPSGRLAFQS